MAGGHDGAAHELARRLRARGLTVDVRDYLAALPFGSGWALRWLYAQQLRRAPASYSALYRVLGRPGPLLALSIWLSTWACPRLRRWARGYDCVVATYPLAGQALGRLRRSDAAMPLVVFLTDFSAHPLWVVDGADLHLTLHPVTAAQVRAIAPAARVRVAGALVGPAFTAPTGAGDAAIALRSRLGVLPSERLALMVAGSWGVGDIEDAAREIVASGVAHPVIVCGRNELLRRRLESEGLGTPLGWVEDMATLMRASDLLVQNAGGLTALEAFAVGLPVVSYGCLPGHGRTNSVAMAEAGVASHGCRYPSLAAALALLDPAAQRERAARVLSTDPADSIVDSVAAGVDEPVRSPRRRSRSGLAVAGLTSVVLCAGAATSGVAYAATHGVGVLRAPADANGVVVVVRATRLPDAVTLRQLTGLKGCLAVSPTMLASGLGAGSRGVPLLLDRPVKRPPSMLGRDRAGRVIVLVHRKTNAVEMTRALLAGADPMRPSTEVKGGVLPPLQEGAVVVVDAAEFSQSGLRDVLTQLAAVERANGWQPMSAFTLHRGRQ